MPLLAYYFRVGRAQARSPINLCTKYVDDMLLCSTAKWATRRPTGKSFAWFKNVNVSYTRLRLPKDEGARDLAFTSSGALIHLTTPNTKMFQCLIDHAVLLFRMFREYRKRCSYVLLSISGSEQLCGVDRIIGGSLLAFLHPYSYHRDVYRKRRISHSIGSMLDLKDSTKFRDEPTVAAGDSE